MTDAVRGALQALYDDCMEYIRINNLAGAENNHVLRQARAALAQSDAEPVAWRYSKGGSVWFYTDEPHIARKWHEAEWKIEPLFTVPPRPNVSAGLIEAAEWHEELAKEKLKQAKQAPEAKKPRFLDISFFHDECASSLRARAADRSGK